MIDGYGEYSRHEMLNEGIVGASLGLIHFDSLTTNGVGGWWVMFVWRLAEWMISGCERVCDWDCWLNDCWLIS